MELKKVRTMERVFGIIPAAVNELENDEEVSREMMNNFRMTRYAYKKVVVIQEFATGLK